MRIAPTQSIPEGNRLQPSSASRPRREWKKIFIASCRDSVSCRNSVMQDLPYVVDVAEKQGLSSGSRIATTQDEQIHRQQLDPRKRTRENTALA